MYRTGFCLRTLYPYQSSQVSAFLPNPVAAKTLAGTSEGQHHHTSSPTGYCCRLWFYVRFAGLGEICYIYVQLHGH